MHSRIRLTLNKNMKSLTIIKAVPIHQGHLTRYKRVSCMIINLSIYKGNDKY